MATDRVGPTITTLKAEVDFLGNELRQLKADNERLRNELHITQAWSARVIAGHEEDVREITALRAENEAILAANRDVMLHWDVLKADYERLREALELFACDCSESELCKFPHACRNYIARAALDGQPAPGKEEA